MELNDNEFDTAFRKKVFDADPQFEEAAWNKMEQKLRRRDRMVFFKKAAVLCLLFFVAFGGYMLREHQPVKDVHIIAKKSMPKPGKPVPETERVVTNVSPLAEPIGISKVARSAIGTNQVNLFADTAGKKDQDITVVQLVAGSATIENSPVAPAGPAFNSSISPDSGAVALPGSDVAGRSVTSIVKQQKVKRSGRFPLTLSLSAGPEFNSSGALIGGKKGFSAGAGIGLGIAKRLTLQTGLRYSAKYYAAENYEYKFRSDRVKSLISGVSASCAVLEIPIQASYTIFENARKSVDINAGMSSYLMLKEDYNFRYTAESGYSDRLQQFRNKNQHYFGVVDLSATYYIKLKKEKFRLGLEPYVKIPVTGVGEGRVNLKSSGVSIKLRYELEKKRN